MTFLRLSFLCFLLGAFTACGDIKVTGGSDTGGNTPGSCTTDSDCTSSLSCVVATCNKAKGTCSETVAPGKCLIGDTCYNEGQSEPGVPCKVCLPELDPYTFLNKTCGDAEVCDSATGDCVSDGSQKCGNSKLEGTETCDDGNTAAGDGCSDGCETEAGWECATAGDACVDIDECGADPSPCDVNATCTNTDGAFECACGDGYDGDGATCADIDECAADESPCAANEACTNTDGGFECACAGGYLADDDGACQDVDECAADESPCDANGTCENTDGSFTCTCNEGWVANDDGTCGDLDECAADESPCAANQDCTNSEGAYECSCSAGYAADADGACQDVDECADTVALIEDFSAVDEDGDPVAPEGWTMIWSDMLDVNKEDPVSWFINADGQLQYSNKEGTNYNGSTNGVAALPKMDINAGDMLHASVAVQVEDQDWEGYDAASIAFLSCSTDVAFDACLLAYDEETADADGNPIATLVPLWSKTDYNNALEDGGKAGDVIDIAIDLSAAAGWSGWLHFAFDSVDDYANEGSGFIVDNVSVVQASQVCGANEGCANTDGGFECSCLDGFEADADGACGDIDECLNADVCGANEDCTNTDGGYDCACSAGYGDSAEDPACVDLNECELGTYECAADATCENTEGNYSCVCKDGFVGDGKTCDNVDECTEATDECGAYTTCSDTVPGIKCQDPNGSCDDAACNAAVNALDGFCNGANWDSLCAACAAGGQTWAGDDCSGVVDACSAGKYACTCDDGYGPDEGGLTCSDIDECATDADGCAQNCSNTVGGYECSCNEGYTLAADTMGCDDVDECAVANGGCANICTNTDGGFECGCPAGYFIAADGSGCDDVNECAANNGGCAQTCTNAPGFYTCSCNAGYTLNGNGGCDDINECADNNGGCAQTCTNSDGGFLCGCDAGYILAANDSDCDDIDECAFPQLNNCNANATCTNNAGGFTCMCNLGYSGDGVECTEDGGNGIDISQNGKMVFGHHGNCSGWNGCGSAEGCADMACQHYGYNKAVSWAAITHSAKGGCTAEQQWNLFGEGYPNGIELDWADGDCGSGCEISGVANVMCEPLCGNPNGGNQAGDNGTGLGVKYCYNSKDSNQTRAKKACESHHGEGNCCVIASGYNGQQYGLCNDGGNAFHWHWDNHPKNHCKVTKNGQKGQEYVVGDVINPGYCGTVTGNFLQ